MAVVVTLSVTVSLAVADDVEFQAVVSRNDASVGGEFHLDLEMRITSGTSPRTLNSLTVDVYYGAELTEWSANPAVGWAFGSALGYSRSADKFAGYYRVLVTGSAVNEDENPTPPGSPPGWDVTNSWQKIVTLRWTINTATSVDILISDDTDAAAYFDNYTNAPPGDVTDWVGVTNQDLGDVSLPVALSSFTTEVGDGFVKLIWTTESEVDNLGFHIYRSLSEDGEYERITAERIEGMGASSTQHKYTFRDPNVTPGITYWYKLEDVAFDGTRTMHGAISVTPQLRVREEVVVVLPDAYALSPCYPNPFNPSTTIRYQLPEPGEVRLAIYDVLGQEMRVLVSETQPAGWYRVMWDGRDDRGIEVSSGVYLYQLCAGTYVETRRMIMAR